MMRQTITRAGSISNTFIGTAERLPNSWTFQQILFSMLQKIMTIITVWLIMFQGLTNLNHVLAQSIFLVA